MQNAFIETPMEKGTPNRTEQKHTNKKRISRCLASSSISHTASEPLSVSFITQFLCYSFWSPKKISSKRRWFEMKHLNYSVQLPMISNNFWMEFRSNQNRVIILMAPNQHSIVMNCVIDSIRCDFFPLAKKLIRLAIWCRKKREKLIVALEFRNISTFFHFLHHFHLVNISANCKESNNSIEP